MAYQTLEIVKAVKAGLVDLDSKRVVWAHATNGQGLKFANDGKTILYAVNDKGIAHGNATWSTAAPQHGAYGALLEKTGTGAGDQDESIHLQFTPDLAVVTLQTLDDAIPAAPGDLSPQWSFHHISTGGVANYAQFELRFEDPVSEGWLEVTIFALQGHNGDASTDDELMTDTTNYMFGGNTPDGSSVWEVGAHALGDVLSDVNAAWDIAEDGQVATAYVLKRVRLELWEAEPSRTCEIDDVMINGVNYAVEPGMTGAELGPNSDYVILNFVEVRDRFGRLEVLAPKLGAKQALIVGPLLPELFNDTAGFVRFKPILIAPPLDPAAATGVEYTYVAIQVANPS